MAYSGVNSNSTYQLLTPNAFELTQPPDVNKQLSDALAEITRLKQENELQKQKKLQAEKMTLPPIQSQKTCHLGQAESILNLESHTPQLSLHTQSKLYMENLITHQAAEMAELKQQICQLTADHCIELKLLEDTHHKEIQKILDDHRTEISNLKYCHHEEITKVKQDALITKQQNEKMIIDLESELKHKEKMYETKVAVLSQDHKSEVEILQNQSGHLQKEVDEVKNIYRTKVELLQDNLDDLKKKSECQILQLQQELNLKSIESENQFKQVAQLKAYIGESENIPKSVEILKTENSTLKNKLNICIAEKEHLQSNIELLNIRLSSMTEILNIQEAELTQDKHGEPRKEKQENALLKRWREKVFALLVQQKSASVVLKNDENKWKQKMSNAQSHMESAENQIQILCHSLSDKQAQLDISNNNSNMLQNDLLATQQQLDLLSNQSTKDQKMMLALKNFTLSIGSKFQEHFQYFETINIQLASLGHRINFASSRVLLLQNVIFKQKYLSKVHQQLQTEIPIKDSTEESTSQLLADPVPVYAKTELVRLQKERDLLAMQLTEIMQGMEERIQTTRTEYKEQETYLKKELLETQNSLQAALEKCDSMTLEFQEMQKKFEEKNTEVESLKLNLSKQKAEGKQTMDKLEEKYNEALTAQFAEMDKKVADARRQHIKAEIALRQAERQQEREQTYQQKTMEKHFKYQLTEIRNQLQAVESERNLMMATLRQEGLMGKLKFDCFPQKQNVTSTVNRTTTLTFPEVASCTLEDKEIPLELLLEDMKQISTDIFEDSSDESFS